MKLWEVNLSLDGEQVFETVLVQAECLVDAVGKAETNAANELRADEAEGVPPLEAIGVKLTNHRLI